MSRRLLVKPKVLCTFLSLVFRQIIPWRLLIGILKYPVNDREFAQTPAISFRHWHCRDELGDAINIAESNLKVLTKPHSQKRSIVIILSLCSLTPLALWTPGPYSREVVDNDDHSPGQCHSQHGFIVEAISTCLKLSLFQTKRKVR